MTTNRKKQQKYFMLSCAIATWIALPGLMYSNSVQAEGSVYVTADRAHEEAKYNSQQVSIITKKDIEQKQAKSVEDIIFTESGVSRTVDSMGRVGVSIRGAEARHTLILVDGQAVLGDLAKFSGAADEVMRLGTENVERIEIVQGSASAKYGSDAIGGVVNIITKKAAKKPTIQINGEGSRAKGGETGYGNSNFFLRADSGQMGKVRVAISGSKRDVMPVLGTKARRDTGDTLEGDFKPNALRYYGTTDDIGFNATYDINQNHNIQLRLDRFTEDLVRDVKNTTSPMEPQRHFKRDSNRNTMNAIWNGRSGVSDWKLELNHSRINENDVSLVDYSGRSKYEGKNELKYIDDIDHRQTDIRFNANSAIGDKHTLSWGFANTKETGSGSRLKNSPITRTKYIDPFNYSKDLLVAGVDRLQRKAGDNSLRVWSHVHDFKISFDKNNKPFYDQNYEYYGSKNSDEEPDITYEDYLKYDLDKYSFIDPDENPEFNERYAKNGVTKDVFDRIVSFTRKLKKENTGDEFSRDFFLYRSYFQKGESLDPKIHEKAPTFNGVKFLDKYRERDQRVTEGEGSIRKQNFYLSDSWQVNKDLLVQPTIRFDKSNLFGSHVSWNLGATYNVNSNAHRRLKANIGTGYAEPGMGELWYSWQMFDSTPLGVGYSKMGWYWIGNPNLKPETSRNIDLSFEGEGKNDYARIGVFQNRIHNYMSVYFTGSLLDWAPRLSKDDKWMRAPDLVYSFKNIGKAQITGLQLEWKHKFGSKWSSRFGLTRLQALNKSDPTMPRHLLDRPTNKIDFGVTFETNKWNAQVWADYYHKMLDSNTLEGKSNYWNGSIDSDSRIFNKTNIYEEKSYGIWNAMVQRKFDKDSIVYFGVNNIFNHRDDDRATQARVYRFGVNLKFGAGGDSKAQDAKVQNPAVTNGINGTTPITKVHVDKAISTVNGDDMGREHQFLERPFDAKKEKGIEFIGDYRARLMAHDGSEHAQSLYTSSAYVDTGAYNFKDNTEHGLEQRIRFGVDAKINDHTNVKVLASASGNHSVDTASTTVQSKGLNKQRLENLDVTNTNGRWDFSAGRLSEKMGTTGYWFNKTFDGLRAVWTDQRNQFRAGVGSFKSSTGITDSAYNHSEYNTFFRAPTMNEFIGLYRNLYGDTLSAMYKSAEDGEASSIKWEDGKRVPSEGSAMDVYRKLYKGKNDNLYFMEQLSEVDRDMANATEEERNAKKLEIIRRMATIIQKAYPELLNDRYVYNLEERDDSVKVMYEVSDEKGNKAFLSASIKSYQPTIFDPGADQPELRKIEVDEKKALTEKVGRPLSDLSLLDPSTIETNINTLTEHYTDVAKWVAKDDWFNKYIYGKDRTYRTHSETTPDGIKVEKENTLGFSELQWGLKTYKYDLFKLENGTIKEMSENEKDALNKPLSKYHLTGVTKIVKIGYDSHYNDVNIKEELKKGNFSTESSDLSEGDLPRIAKDYLGLLDLAIRDSETGNTLPREALEKIIGKPIQVTGLTLQRDTIPAIDKAVFAQYKTRINDRLGVQAWFLHSLNDENTVFKSGFMGTTAKTVRVQIGTGPSTTDEDGYDIPGEPIYGDKTIELPNPINHTYTSNKLANVFSIGLQYQLGNSALLSVDYGQNRTGFGRYMNGHTNYEHTPGTADFKLKGHSMGGTPHFWTARLDLGQSDYTRPGSWNAFVDYKYFAHGSFFGGNGTGAVPDRYLDGIRSFTLGGGYVPRKDLLLEAFYTFDAKGIGQRDTLYGGENFKLGNYTRIQGTYKF